MPLHHLKGSHQQCDEETTAYSSWQDDEDGNSQLSSIFSCIDLDKDNKACLGEEICKENDAILLSSSECSLLNNDDDDSSRHVDRPSLAANNINVGANSIGEEEKRNILYQELSERASSLLQRESSSAHLVEDYFRRSYYDEATNNRSYDGNDDAVRSDYDKFCHKFKHLMTPLSTESNAKPRCPAPIDKSCRSKMIEWSFRVVDFSFPLPQQEQDEDQPRKHSIEALHLICTTFSYVDRLCTKFKVVDREEYKLMTMVCLSLAAKSSGLFAAENEEIWCDFVNEPTTQQDSDGCSQDGADCSSFTDQNIQSTLDDDDVAMQFIKEPRPSIDLISLPGLQTLCKGTYSMEQFFAMEHTVLKGLNWRLNSVHTMSWVELCLDLITLLQHDGKTTIIEDDYNSIQEMVLLQVEHVIDMPSFVGCAPSLLAIAAVLNAVERNSDVVNCDSLLDYIEDMFSLTVDMTEVETIRYMQLKS